ncbi:MAG TPA: DUF2865 domain-containing protein [Bradyrhizobium sp.]|jgi:hypothetical protein|uniref:DUF2865 domain-containing protein n=1 Tax=Bradyrhizobium sp. TaxID=376 RepID=UPI002C63183F|nr:DUF2865 domain-containing protein [Bradyrhizobium sp.]HXB77498.1 DUF2865 domain-containing protein [Bradyrhizobium sp.]
MPEILIACRSRSILTCAVLLCSMLGGPARAQVSPPPPSQAPAANPICVRLEAQMAAVDRGGGGDPAKDEQIRRYQEAASKQQGELDRITLQAKRMGCDSSGFFSLFNNQSAQCGPVNNQIQQMRANLDQITTSLERLRSGGLGGSDRENQRRSVLVALAQNNCGQQYANAVQQMQGPGNFLSNLFGNNTAPMTPPADLGPPSGTYRTVCVRSCDGAFFPISFATVPARFPDDDRTCKAQCPATEASLYSYRNPGEDMNQAVSISGQLYSSLPNAFRFRQEFNPSCSCKAAGQTWSDALKSIDDKAAAEQQGDIIVTEESAKKMSRPIAKSTPVQGKKGSTAAVPAPDPAPTPAPAASTAAATSGATPDNKTIRSVGPTFIPAR